MFAAIKNLSVEIFLSGNHKRPIWRFVIWPSGPSVNTFALLRQFTFAGPAVVYSISGMDNARW
ncbi:MAG: hypothetical protein CMB79_05565 [Filomicrobium sp.]|nr:hypothetical protein [Filomicrobium sp.]